MVSNCIVAEDFFNVAGGGGKNVSSSFKAIISF